MLVGRACSHPVAGSRVRAQRPGPIRRDDRGRVRGTEKNVRSKIVGKVSKVYEEEEMGHR